MPLCHTSRPLVGRQPRCGLQVFFTLVLLDMLVISPSRWFEEHGTLCCDVCYAVAASPLSRLLTNTNAALMII